MPHDVFAAAVRAGETANDAPELQRGQMWVVSDGSESVFGLVQSCDSGASVSRIIPLDTVGDMHSQGSVTIPARGNPLGLDLLAWPDLATSIPNRFFKNFIGRMPQCSLESVESGVDGAAPAKIGDASDVAALLRSWHSNS